MPKNQTIVVSSTHLDKQGFVMSKEALESMLPFLNGNRCVKLGVEHIRTFPPYGKVTNGKIIQGEDKEYYLTAENIFFDKKEVIELKDGTTLFKECFKENNKPFLESEVIEIKTIHISTDPANFENPDGFDNLIKIITEKSELEVHNSMIGRKSELPDPEFIIQITNTIVIALGLGVSKIPQKIGEAIGDDLVKFYNLIKTSAFEMIKRTIPKNRPKNFVVEFVQNEVIVELIVTTNNPEDVILAISKEKLSEINEKLISLSNLSPEKMQFVFNKDKNWEFNYLLTKNGEAIGKPKSFKKRNEMFKKILENQIKPAGNKM